MSANRTVALGASASVLAFAATAVLWNVAPGAFAHGWLAAWAVWIGLPLGCMGLLFIHALTGGAWGRAIAPELISGAATLPLLLLFVIPILLSASRLYPWLAPGQAALPNAFYLNAPFALGRLGLYILVWFALLALIRRAPYRRKDALTRVAPIALIALALSATFMSIDAVMSLDPRFPSSVFGLLRMAEMGLFALAAATLSALWRGLDGPPLRELGRILLALAILLAYLDFVQLLIVWQSNLPNEAAWYGPRLSGAWGALAAAIALTHFVLPFFILLSPRAQRSRSWMSAACALLILSACARALWLVGPESRSSLSLLAATFAAAIVGMLAASAALAEAMRPQRGARDGDALESAGAGAS